MAKLDASPIGYLIGAFMTFATTMLYVRAFLVVVDECIIKLRCAVFLDITIELRTFDQPSNIGIQGTSYEISCRKLD